MNTINLLSERRSYYDINKNIPVGNEDIIKLVERSIELVPDAFNMKSSRLVLAMGSKHDRLWDGIYDVFKGKVSREKINSFKSGYGTVLYFYDEEVVESYQSDYEGYRDNFPVWANQASAMLQLSIWTGLRELGLGASLQHYNPIIDRMVCDMFDLPESYRLVAQMPFGAIGSQPEAKEREDVYTRLKVES